jgi:hypothetical protein
MVSDQRLANQGVLVLKSLVRFGWKFNCRRR